MNHWSSQAIYLFWENTWKYMYSLNDEDFDHCGCKHGTNDCSASVIYDVAHDLKWVSQSFTFVCFVNIFNMCEQMSQSLSWHTVKLPSFHVVVCAAAEKGWIQPISHKPLSSLRLLSGPGSPKKRAFTLHCACYSSQHSTHGHVSVFIALNINFHSHHVLCLHGIFSYPNNFLFSSSLLKSILHLTSRFSFSNRASSN